MKTCTDARCRHDHCGCPRYVAEFIRDWRAETRGQRMIDRAYESQLSNLRAILYDRRHYGRVPHWCDVGQYIQSVRMLGRATREWRI